MDYSFLIVFLILIGFMFFMSMGQKKEAAKRQAFLDALKSGDQIETISGLFGEIVEVDGDKLTVQVGVGSQVKVCIHKNGVRRVV